MLKLLTTALVSVLLLVSSNLAMAQGKIAVLNIQEAILNTEFAQERLKKLRATDDFTTSKNRFDTLKKEGQELVEKLKKDEQVMSPEQREALMKKISSKREDLEFVLRKLQEAEKELSQQILAEMSEQAKGVIDEMIKKEGIGLLLDRQVALFVDSSYSITAKVTDKLNQKQ